MRQLAGTTWECTACGAVVRIRRGVKPVVWLRTADHQERLVVVDGTIAHRCEFD